jgi:branched-chain amino acid transport system ATP-binding protein
MEALRLEHLSKSFGGLRVLEDISLTIDEGERVVRIGPNGAGTTPLLNRINGQLPPTSGKIYLFGEDVTTLSVHARAHRGIARSFQILSV